ARVEPLVERIRKGESACSSLVVELTRQWDRRVHVENDLGPRGRALYSTNELQRLANVGLGIWGIAQNEGDLGHDPIIGGLAGDLDRFVCRRGATLVHPPQRLVGAGLGSKKDHFQATVAQHPPAAFVVMEQRVDSRLSPPTQPQVAN